MGHALRLDHVTGSVSQGNFERLSIHQSSEGHEVVTMWNLGLRGWMFDTVEDPSAHVVCEGPIGSAIFSFEGVEGFTSSG